MKVTLDTNILISGSFWTGDPYRILSLIEKGALELVLSEAIINEYLETLQDEEVREKVINKKLIILEAAEKIIKDATIVEPTLKIDIIKEDPDDNVILECAVEGRADYIVTRDNHLLKIREFEGIKIVTPDEFLKIIGQYQT